MPDADDFDVEYLRSLLRGDQGAPKTPAGAGPAPAPAGPTAKRRNAAPKKTPPAGGKPAARKRRG